MDAVGWGATEVELAQSAHFWLPFTFLHPSLPLPFFLTGSEKSKTWRWMSERSKQKNMKKKNVGWSKECEKAPLIWAHYKRSKHSVNWAATLVDHLFFLTHCRDSKREARGSVAISCTSISAITEHCIEDCLFTAFSQLVYSSLFKPYHTFSLKLHSQQSCLKQIRRSSVGSHLNEQVC